MQRQHHNEWPTGGARFSPLLLRGRAIIEWNELVQQSASGECSATRATLNNNYSVHSLAVDAAAIRCLHRLLLVVVAVVSVVAVPVEWVNAKEDSSSILLAPDKEPQPESGAKEELQVFVPLCDLGDLKSTIWLRIGGRSGRPARVREVCVLHAALRHREKRTAEDRVLGRVFCLRGERRTPEP